MFWWFLFGFFAILCIKIEYAWIGYFMCMDLPHTYKHKDPREELNDRLYQIKLPEIIIGLLILLLGPISFVIVAICLIITSVLFFATHTIQWPVIDLRNVWKRMRDFEK